jgi:hypothetical protein
MPTARHAEKMVEGRWLTANGVIGLYPANSVNDDDIAFYTDESRTESGADLVRPAPADREAGGGRRADAPAAAWPTLSRPNAINSGADTQIPRG